MIRYARVSTFVIFSLSLAGCGGTTGVSQLPQAGALAPASHGTARQAAAATAATTPTQAAAAQAFVDSVGANVHLSYYGSPYDPSTFSKLQSLIAGSGIKHLRDGMPYGQNAPVTEAQALASNGVRFDYLIGEGASSSQVEGWFSDIGPNVADACEGPNEPDFAGGDWAPAARTAQQTIYGVCHPKGLPVFAPAMGVSEQSYATLGNVGAIADDANIHDYFGYHNPGTPGYYDGNYGSLGYDENGASKEDPGAPFIATETGYSSSPNDSLYLPEVIRTRYTARIPLEAFRSGVKRTYLYEFADEGGSPASANGLVDGSLDPKPSYGAVGGLLTMLADPNASFTPGSLAFTITGGDANVHSVLLQKHDGTFWLALWEETLEYDGDAKTYQVASPESLTIGFAQTPSAITTHVLQDSGAYASTSLAPSSSIALAVDGHPTLVQIQPQRTVAMVQTGFGNNGSYGTYALAMPSSTAPGDAIFGGLASARNVSSALNGFAVVDGNSSNGQLESTFDDRIVAAGDPSSLPVSVDGADWASGVAFEASGEDASAPIASDTSADSTNANVTCPASASGATIRAGSLVTCFVYVNGGTQASGLSQSPTAPSGWVLDRTSNAQYTEVYLFHRTAPTTAGESVASMTVNFSTNGGWQYLTGTHAQTIVVQPSKS